jgi:hypothetical protein
VDFQGEFKMGVIGTSKKEDERRVPIHPEHLKRLPEYIRRQLIFEKGYGAPSTLVMMKSLTELEVLLPEVKYYPILDQSLLPNRSYRISRN